MSVVDDIKTQLDLVDIVSQSVKLRRTGKNYIGFCPFHSNTRTPSFVVFPETQTWRCFGQCNEGGDLFGFVMKREGWDFSETLKFLADKAGVQLTPKTEASEKDEKLRETLSNVMDAALEFYRQQMLETEAGKEALAYLRKRGLNDETIKIWGLGFAPQSWDELGRHLRAKGYPTQLIMQAGLLTERDSGDSYDKFRNRLMFPIRDTFGKLVGFGGRVLDPNDVPKYMNSPKTELFDKGRLLYGMDLARKPIRTDDQVVIVEGYMDVIGLHQAGFNNAVSPMGTALTEDQFKILKKYTRNIVLALDPDAAGQSATLRGLETARKSMDQQDEISFDSKGLLHVEKHIKADIRVTTLPDGQDPDEIVLADAEKWKQIVSSAKPVVVHVMETLAEGKDLNDGKIKREIAAQVTPLIEDVADAIERDAYRQQLARLLKVDERVLIPAGSVPVNPRRKRIIPDETQTFAPERINTAAQRNRLLEKHALQYLYKQPESFYKINRTLGLLGLASLGEADFQETDFKNGYNLVIAGLEQDLLAPSDYIEKHLPEEFEFIEAPDLVEKTLEPTPQKAFQDQIRNILRIRLNLIEERIQQIKFLQSEMEEKTYTEEEAQVLYMEQVMQRRLIDIAMQSPEAGGSGNINKPKKRPYDLRR